MSAPVRELRTLLRTLEPELHEGVFVFAVAPAGTGLAEAGEVAATFREAEGLTLVLEEEAARRRNLQVRFRAAWITLRVHSDLEAVGLTAAFASALARAGIACNVLAGAFHDHLFVPVDAAGEALAVLRRLSSAEGPG